MLLILQNKATWKGPSFYDAHSKIKFWFHLSFWTKLRTHFPRIGTCAAFLVRKDLPPWRTTVFPFLDYTRIFIGCPKMWQYRGEYHLLEIFLIRKIKKWITPRTALAWTFFSSTAPIQTPDNFCTRPSFRQKFPTPFPRVPSDPCDHRRWTERTPSIQT